MSRLSSFATPELQVKVCLEIQSTAEVFCYPTLENINL